MPKLSRGDTNYKTEKIMSISIFAPYESLDHGLAELLTLTMSIKDDKKGLKGQIVMALARLEQTVIQKCPEGTEKGATS